MAQHEQQEEQVKQPPSVESLADRVERLETFLAADVDRIAQELARLIGDLDKRLAGVRSDGDVALMEQVGLLLGRIKRLEALVSSGLAGRLDGVRRDLAQLR